MKLKNGFCSECGCEIIFLYETPTKCYAINEMGELVRDDNNLTDRSELIPRCSFDLEHEIEPQDEIKAVEFSEWVNTVITHFNKHGLNNK